MHRYYPRHVQISGRNTALTRSSSKCNTAMSFSGLLREWVTFLGSKFKWSASDENRDLESTAAQEDSLRENEQTDCLLALRSGKATGWDNIPIEAYRGSSGARNELFRICRLMWTTEQVPIDLVRGTFTMLYNATISVTIERYACCVTLTSCCRLSWLECRCKC